MSTFKDHADVLTRIEVLAKACEHITDAEIAKDIDDTEIEIKYFRIQGDRLSLMKIPERESFIATLQALQKYRIDNK